MADKINIRIWNEFVHEKEHEAVRKLYPHGMHKVIAEGLEKRGNFAVSCSTLEMPEHGLTQEVLDKTDVLFWWGHMAHDQVSDAVVERVKKRVLEGMGFIALHSAHYSTVFRGLMGSSCSLKWREAAEKERIWVVDRSHPIAEGLDEYLEIPHEEMYGERFDIPAPDELVFISWFQGGEVFRSGCTWKRGSGNIFYFRPGHETYPTYYNEQVLDILANAARWAAARVCIPDICPSVASLEALPEIPQEFGSAGVEQSAEDLG